MCELIEFVQYQDSLYLFKTPMPTVYKAGVKDFFFTMQFAYDDLSLIGMVHGVEIFID